jgi:hypothetical protein
MDNQKAMYSGSTAPNTSTCQKYMTVGSSEGHSDAKAVQDTLDSPYAIRRFVDSESGAGANSNKIHEKGEFKPHYPHANSNIKSLQEYIPYQFEEICFNMAQVVGHND